MPKEMLAWGILGTGNIARTFARGVQGSETGTLVAVGSRSQASADAFADEFAIPLRFAGYAELLADPSVQAVYIALPHPSHAEWAIKAAEAGKHILCEKPLTVNSPQTMAVIEAARQHDVFLMEAFMYRCHPQTIRLVQLLRDGEIGEVKLIEASFSFDTAPRAESRLFSQEFGGGGILDVGCYPMSMARLVAGVATGKSFAEPTAVTAVGHLGETQVDEYSTASVSFPGAIIAQLTTGIRVRGANLVRIIGSTGTLLLNDPWVPIRDGGTTTIQLQTHADGAVRTIEIVAEKGLYSYEADTVAACIPDRQSQAMSWDDSLGNVAALDQWRAAIGLSYEFEKSGSVQPVAGRPLTLRATRPIPTVRLAGIEKPVSRLVLGVDNQRTASHAAVMFDEFFERGGTCYDTAYIYMSGLSEQLLGDWLVSRGVREQVVLLDKGAHTPYCTPEHLTAQLHQSLERLRTDYVDIYMLHRDNLDVPVGEFIDVLNTHQRAGRMKIFGASNWSLQRIDAANEYANAHGLAGFAAVSNNVSLAEMVEPPWGGCISSSDAHSLDWFEQRQLPLFPWSSQARGFFAGAADPSNHSDPELVRCWYSDTNFARLDRAKQLAGERGVLPINIALAYMLCLPFPTFPLIGPRTLQELNTALPGLDVVLTLREIRWLRDGERE